VVLFSAYKRLIPIVVVLPIFASVGCGGGPQGPKRYAISGVVKREGIDVDAGSINFVPTGSGVSTSVRFEKGKYQFTSKDGVPAGKYKVNILQDPLRDPTYKGKMTDAPVLEDTRFKGKMPPGGWNMEATVAEGQKDPINFEIPEDGK